MINLFQEIFHVGHVETDPAKYVAKYSSQIKDAGQLLEYLRLAKRYRQSPLVGSRRAFSWN
jgi:hypothetical protein